jgi:hypothetical protein
LLAYLESYRDLTLEELERKNHNVCLVLTGMGFGGHHLRVDLPRKPAPKRKDAPASGAYPREYYVELSEANTAGKHFALTGGMHLTSEEMQLAFETRKRKKQFEVLAAKRAKAMRESKESDQDAKVLADLKEKGVQYETEEGSAALTCAQLDTLLRAVLGKTVKGNKPEKLARWSQVRGQEFLSARPRGWTDEEEALYLEAQREVLEIKDTYLGRELEKKKMEAGATLVRASPGTDRDLFKTWYATRSPGSRKRLAETFASVKDEIEDGERDGEEEEEEREDDNVV